MGVALGVGMLKRWAPWLLLAASVVVVLLAVLFGGWFGFLGDGIESQLHELVTKYSRELLWLGKAIGSACTLATGLLGVRKAYRYAEFSLPERLQDFLNESQRELLGDRETLITKLEQYYSKAPQLGIFESARTLFPTLQPRVQAPYSRELGDHIIRPGETVEGIETRLKLRVKRLDTVKRQNEIQLATAYLLQGLDRIHRAEQAGRTETKPKISQADIISLRKEAIEKFSAAAKIDPTEYRAFEHAADQAIIIRAFDNAKRITDEWSDVALRQTDNFQNARALRFGANAEFERSNDVSLNGGERTTYRTLARDQLVESRRILSDDIPNTDQAKGLELGQTNELLGRVRIKLGTLPTAKSDLSRARDYYVLQNTKADVDRVDDILSGLL